MSIRNKLKNNTLLYILAVVYLSASDFFRIRLVAFVGRYFWFASQYRKFKKLNDNTNFQLSPKKMLPCLNDNLSSTPLDAIYFYQDTWAAEKIFNKKPGHHYDIGSAAKTIGIISQFTPTTMIDIRPIELPLKNLFFIKGSILSLPFEDESIESISSLCVIEHIGLGRYGDPLDSWGSEKAIKEIIRVAKKGGMILISVPVDDTSRIYFNAHRAFTPEYVRTLFKGCKLMDEKYIYGNKLEKDYMSSKGYGIGLFMFEKN
jgi:hypothetical protein